jgi:hypothetical protein
MARYIDVIELEKRIKENIKPETLEEKALIEWCKDECIRQAFAIPFVNDALIKADTVRKMQERIKQYIDVGHYRSPTEICFSELDVANIIDRIAKEMLEGDNGIQDK